MIPGDPVGPVVQCCDTVLLQGLVWGSVWLGQREEPGSDSPVVVGPRWPISL